MTSFGIYYLIRNRRIWNLDFILEHNNNELFVLLLYPFIKFKTIKSLTDPEIIHDKFEKLVDAVIDGGVGGMIPSTVVDFSKVLPR